MSDPMPQPLAQNEAALKRIVIGLGVLIVIALGALVIGLVLQAQKASEAVLNDSAAPSVPIAGTTSISSPAPMAALPEGAQIKSVHTAEKHLVIRYGLPSGIDEVAVVELRSGKLLYRIAP